MNIEIKHSFPVDRNHIINYKRTPFSCYNVINTLCFFPTFSNYLHKTNHVIKMRLFTITIFGLSTLLSANHVLGAKGTFTKTITENGSTFATVITKDPSNNGGYGEGKMDKNSNVHTLTKTATQDGKVITTVITKTDEAHFDLSSELTASTPPPEMYTKTFTVTESDTTYVSAITKTAEDYIEYESAHANKDVTTATNNLITLTKPATEDGKAITTVITKTKEEHFDLSEELTASTPPAEMYTKIFIVTESDTTYASTITKTAEDYLEYESAKSVESVSSKSASAKSKGGAAKQKVACGFTGGVAIAIAALLL